MDNLHRGMYRGSAILWVLLNLFVAFDIISHSILLGCLAGTVSEGTMLWRLWPFLERWSQKVCVPRLNAQVALMDKTIVYEELLQNAAVRGQGRCLESTTPILYHLNLLPICLRTSYKEVVLTYTASPFILIMLFNTHIYINKTQGCHSKKHWRCPCVNWSAPSLVWGEKSASGIRFSA